MKDQKIILSPQLIYSIIEKEKTGSASAYRAADELLYILFLWVSALLSLRPHFWHPIKKSKESSNVFVSMRRASGEYMCGLLSSRVDFFNWFFSRVPQSHTRNICSSFSIKNRNQHLVRRSTYFRPLKSPGIKTLGYLLLFFCCRVSKASPFSIEYRFKESAMHE